MKKIGAFSGLWAGALAAMIVCSSSSTVPYTIAYDSESRTTYHLKEEIQDTYNELVSGVHSSSYILMVLQNLERFEVEEDVRASWEQNRLLITEGDGEGIVIEGELEAYSICIPKVQPRSFLQELFS